MSRPSRRRTRMQAKAAGRTILRKVLLLAAVVLTIGAAVAATVWSARVRMFPIAEVVFSGNQHLSDEELTTLAGVSLGESLPKVSSRALSERLLRSPWIKEVRVRKQYPDRIYIFIREAVPFAILDRKGKSFLIDEKGKLLEKLEGDTVPFLPVIAADPDDRRELYREAILLAGIVKERQIATERGRVEIVANGKQPEDLALVIDRVVIKVGSGDYSQKLDRLFSLQEEIKKRAIMVDYVDLRFANRVVVKPVNEVVR